LGCVNYHFTEEKCLVFQWLEGRFSWSATAQSRYAEVSLRKTSRN
jgi:hypothetical protein